MIKGSLLVFITAVLLASCSASPQSTASGSNPQGSSIQPNAPVNSQPAPALSPDEVYQAVSAAWKKLDTAGPRHVSQTTSDSGVVGMTTEADSVPPDFHQVVSLGGTVVAEQYVVGGTIYNNAQGSWTQVSGGGDALSTVGNFAQNLSSDLVYSNGLVDGIEIINGSPAIVYSYTTTLTSLNASAQYKLWVDQVSGLPVKSENITPDGSTIDMTITYDSNLSITLPAEAINAPPAN